MVSDGSLLNTIEENAKGRVAHSFRQLMLTEHLLCWRGNIQTQFKMFIMQQRKSSRPPTSLFVPQWHHFLSQTRQNHLYQTRFSNPDPIPSDGSESKSHPFPSKCSFLLPSSWNLSTGLSSRSSHSCVAFSSMPPCPYLLTTCCGYPPPTACTFQAG